MPYEAYFNYEPLIQPSPRNLIAAEDLPVTSSRPLAMSSPARNWPEESPSSPDPEEIPIARPIETSTPAIPFAWMSARFRSRPHVYRSVHVAPRQLLLPPRPSSIGIGLRVAIPGQRLVEPVGAPPNANAPPAVGTSADSSTSAAELRRARIIRRNSGTHF